MKVAEVDTAGIDSEAQPLARDNRRGYSVVEGGSSPGAPSWFWGGLLLLGLGFVLVLSNSGGGGDEAALAQIDADLEAIRDQQRQVQLASGAAPPDNSAQLDQIQEQLSALQQGGAGAPAAEALPEGHDRFCAWGADTPGYHSRLRLPSAIVPLHYTWTLEPGTAPDATAYAGSIETTLTMAAGEAPSSCVPMHSHPARLTITSVELVSPSGVECMCDEAALPTTRSDCKAQTCAFLVARYAARSLLTSGLHSSKCASNHRADRPGGPESDQVVLNLGGSALISSGANSTVRISYRGTYPTRAEGGSGIYISAPSPQTDPIIAAQFESCKTALLSRFIAPFVSLTWIVPPLQTAPAVPSLASTSRPWRQRSTFCTSCHARTVSPTVIAGTWVAFFQAWPATIVRTGLVALSNMPKVSQFP